MKTSHGFTVVELFIVILLFAVASIVFFVQKNQVEVAVRDDARKTSINAMYYALEEVYFPANKSYPQKLDAKALPSIDPMLFSDPADRMIGESDSDFRYEPTGCVNDGCKGYTLRASLENEDDFIKKNRS